MPKVGNRNFPYTKAGIQQAKRYARATGQSMNESQMPGRRNAIRRPGPRIAPPKPGMRGMRPSSPSMRPSGPSRRGGSRVMRNPGMAPKPKRSY